MAYTPGRAMSSCPTPTCRRRRRGWPLHKVVSRILPGLVCTLPTALSCAQSQRSFALRASSGSLLPAAACLPGNTVTCADALRPYSGLCVCVLERERAGRGCHGTTRRSGELLSASYTESLLWGFPFSW